jgi:hypothetical protein
LAWSGLCVLVFAVDVEVEVPLACDLGMLLINIDFDAGEEFVDLRDEDIFRC